MADGKPKRVAVPVEPLDMAATIAFLRKVAPDTPMTEKNVARLIKVYGIKQKGMAMGGKLKDVPSGNKGLGKLPTPVRNKMGYKAYGGKAKKKMMGGGKVHKKMYAMGGGMRKAKTYG